MYQTTPARLFYVSEAGCGGRADLAGPWGERQAALLRVRSGTCAADNGGGATVGTPPRVSRGKTSRGHTPSVRPRRESHDHLASATMSG